MFGTIRKHSSWLWIIIIVLVVISFVWYMGPASTQGRPVRQGTYGYLYGQPINYDQLIEANQEARIQFFLYSRSWPDESPAARQMFDAQQQTAERLVLLHKLQDLGVYASDDQVARWIAQVFRDPQTGEFSTEIYRQFVETGLRRGGVSEAAFERFARHEVGIQHLLRLAQGTGSLVSEREVEEVFRLQNEQLTTEVATFATSNYLSQVDITPEGSSGFFNAEAARYRVPEKVRVSYVFFSRTNFLAEAIAEMSSRTNLDVSLEALYRQRGTNAFRSPTGEVMTPEAAKEKLRGEIRDQLAMQVGMRAAIDFGEKVLARYDAEPEQRDHLTLVAVEEGVVSGVTEPFSRFERPPGLVGVGTEFAQAAFELTDGQPMSMEPLTAPDGIYLIALKERLEGYVPPMETVLAAVESDFRLAEARKLALTAAEAFSASVASLGEDGSFITAAAAVGATVSQPPVFSAATQSLPGLDPAIDFIALQTAAMDLRAGAVSEAIQTRDGAMVVAVTTRDPAAESLLSTELAGFKEQLIRQRTRAAMEEWFQKEVELAQVSGLPEDLR